MIPPDGAGEFFLRNSNDVNYQNRGIQVGIEDVGIVDLGWRDFESITFFHDGQSGMSYNDFKTPTGLKGTVRVIDDSNVSGMIVFDLDEAWEYEFLDAKDDNINYKIPFRYIKKISPKNYNYSRVELRSGKTLLLDDMRDVTEENAGVLIFERGSKEPVYIVWKKIEEITFE